MVIIFGNQKGGVGKTTLCTLFANHLATMGKKTLVVDCDNQQTISEKRKVDRIKYPDTKFLYNVQTFNIANAENVNKLMTELRRMDGVVLVDSPGNLAQQGLIPLFVFSDYVVCPFQFEATSVNSTVTFIRFISKLKEKYPQMKTKLFFVVNRHGDCIWDLNYNPGRQCIELELSRHLDDEELLLLSSQLTLPADYDGVRMDVQVLCEQV